MYLVDTTLLLFMQISMNALEPMTVSRVASTHQDHLHAHVKQGSPSMLMEGNAVVRYDMVFVE